MGTGTSIRLLHSSQKGDRALRQSLAINGRAVRRFRGRSDQRRFSLGEFPPTPVVESLDHPLYERPMQHVDPALQFLLRRETPPKAGMLAPFFAPHSPFIPRARC